MVCHTPTLASVGTNVAANVSKDIVTGALSFTQKSGKSAKLRNLPVLNIPNKDLVTTTISSDATISKSTKQRDLPMLNVSDTESSSYSEVQK
jgi:hypothetical protein